MIVVFFILMFKFNVGGIVCGVNYEDESYFNYFSMLFEGFISDKKPDILIDLEIVNESEDIDYDLHKELIKRFDSKMNNKLMDVSGDKFSLFYYESLDAVRQVGIKKARENKMLKWFMGEFDLSTKKGFIKMPDIKLNSRKLKESYCFRDCMAFILLFFFVKQKKLFLHASCVVKEGKAIIFSGNSSGGKSTIANFCSEAGYVVLSDEHVLVWKEGNKLMACGTPLGGVLEPTNLESEVKAIYIIGKSKNLEIKRISALEGIVVIQDKIFTNMFLGPLGMKKDIFYLSVDIFSNANFFSLDNEKNNKFIKYV